MENKYKKTLVKIAAVFSIIAVFSLGIVDKASYASDQADDLSAVIVSRESRDDFDEIVDYMEEEDDDLGENIQEGVESPYGKEITQEHIEAVRSVSSESDDMYIKMIKAYEAQQNLKLSLNKRKSQEVTDDELRGHKSTYKDAHKEYRDAHVKALPKVVQESAKLEIKCRGIGCSEADIERLNKYKLFSGASVGDLKLGSDQWGKMTLHRVTANSDIVPKRSSKLSNEDAKLVKDLARVEQRLDISIVFYNANPKEEKLKEIQALNSERTELLIKLGVVEPKKPIKVVENNSGVNSAGEGEKPSGEPRAGDKIDLNKGMETKIPELKDNIKITQSDVDALELKRDVLGAEYSKKLGEGINDPTEVQNAEALFVTSKKLLQLQEKLDDAISLNNRISDATTAKKVEDLQKEYDAMQARYDQIKVYSDSKNTSKPSSSDVDSGKNEELISNKRAQLDKLAKDLGDSNGSFEAMQNLKEFQIANPEFTQIDIDSALLKAEENKITKMKEAEKAKKESLAKEKQDRIDLSEKQRLSIKEANEAELKRLMASGDDVALEKFLDKNPSMRGDVFKMKEAEKAEKERFAKEKQDRIDLSEKQRLSIKEANEAELKRLMASGDDVALEKFLDKNPSMRGDVFKMKEAKKAKSEEGAKAGADDKFKSDDKPKDSEDSAPDPKFKKQQNKDKVVVDEDGNYVRVDKAEGGTKKKNKLKIVVLPQRQFKDSITSSTEGGAAPAISSKIKTPANTTQVDSVDAKIEDNNFNRINLLNEALSE